MVKFKINLFTFKKTKKMITKQSTTELSPLIKSYEKAMEFKTTDLVLNAQGNEFYLYDGVLKGISFLEQNPDGKYVRQVVWIGYPITVEEILAYADVFARIPHTIKVKLNPA